MFAVRTFLLALAVALPALGHVGSPDVFFQGKAGPWPILVSIRPPDAIPGLAHIEVRSLSPGVERIELTPSPMTGEGSQHPPTADVATRSAADPQYFEAGLWLMTVGSWEIHVRVSGAAGSGELAVPVSALALKTLPMQPAIGYGLFGMMLFLSVSMIALVGAAARESKLAPGLPAGPWDRKALIPMAITAVLLIGGLWYGRWWWEGDAATNARRLYKPLGISATAESGSDNLDLRVTDPGWMALRKLDDLVPDHGHLMHLFLIRWPAMDEVFHLHPNQTAPGYFNTAMPSIPAGRYRLYADIVHESGLAETAVGTVNLPRVNGVPLTGDDAGGPIPAPADAGYRIVWNRNAGTPIVAKQVTLFSFSIAGPDGLPVNDLEPYMGMGGHAEFVKEDGSVFAHMHPTGSVPMASVAVASPAEMMAMHDPHPGPQVSFPYGVPTAGKYRVFVQMKRAGKVETGGFAFSVSPI